MFYVSLSPPPLFDPLVFLQIDHTYNDELRMMGLPGDDEDDLGGEELLGANFATGSRRSELL
jgi:hypothetical protein